jgi:uncharacterized membrane protein YphA (DoxX/SURF4 family)
VKLLVEPERRGVDVADWVLRTGAGFLFVLLGAEKLSAESQWVKLFAELGLGQWFRYFTGALQVAGGILLVIPRTSVIGASALASTMLGAIVVHVFVLGDALASVYPAIYLGLIVAAGWKGHERSRRRWSSSSPG